MQIIGILLALLIVGWLVATQVGGSKDANGKPIDPTGYTQPLKTYSTVKDKIGSIEDQTNKARENAIEELDKE